jgi:heavy metal translocating P-type ATPase
MSSAAHERVCDYCHLPLGPGLRVASEGVANEGVANERSEQGKQSAVATEPEYCCFGCRFAASVTAEGGEAGEARWTLARLGVAIFFTMNVMVFTMALWSRDVYADQPSVSSDTAAALYELFRYGCLLFSAPVVLLLGGPILEQAWQSLRRGQITTDWLLSAGVFASLVYSVIAVWTGGAHIYFEVACMVLVAVTLGRWMEASGKLRTTEAIRGLQRLLPPTAHVLDGADHVGPVALDEVPVGATIRVLPGERIPLDGTIARNEASIDQQLITGESEPVTRGVGDIVYAGSLNLDGDLSITVSAPASNGTLQRLVEMVTAALAQKGAEQRLADRLTQWFVPAIGVITLTTFAYYWNTQTFQDGLMTALAVVLIACPCALAIATPMAIWAALGTAAQEQIVFRHGDSLSSLARLRAICFDKTGTLTQGDPLVAHAWFNPEADVESQRVNTARLAASSNHVLAQSILAHLQRESDRDTRASHFAGPPTNLRTVAGRGLTAQLDEHSGDAALGSLRLMQECGLQVPAALQSAIDSCRRDQLSFSCAGWAGRVQAVFAFRETLRPETAAAIRELRELQLHIVLLTGDHQRRAEVLAEELGIEVRAELLPQDKLSAIEEIRAQYGAVAMVGDGVNDAPALAAANVGIALGCGADVSRDAADVCLLGNDLAKIPWAIHWARETRRVIRQNLFWAFAYNSVGVTLAVAQLLSPIIAAIAMVGSSLFVVTNSLKLSRVQDPESDSSAAPAERSPASLLAAASSDSSAQSAASPDSPSPPRPSAITAVSNG